MGRCSGHTGRNWPPDTRGTPVQRARAFPIPSKQLLPRSDRSCYPRYNSSQELGDHRAAEAQAESTSAATAGRRWLGVTALLLFTVFYDGLRSSEAESAAVYVTYTAAPISDTVGAVDTSKPDVVEPVLTYDSGVAQGVTTEGDSLSSVTAADTTTADSPTADTSGLTTEMPELVESGSTSGVGSADANTGGESDSTVTAADAETSDATSADGTGTTTGDPMAVASGSTTAEDTSGVVTTGGDEGLTDSAEVTGAGTGTGPTTGDTTATDSIDAPLPDTTGGDGATEDGGGGVGLQGGQLTVEPACVMQNIDGTRTAYFSYDNMSGSELVVPSDSSSQGINDLVAGGERLSPLTSFLPGRHIGAFAVTFRGVSLEWTVKPAASGPTTARINASTLACAPIKPRAECKRLVVENQLALLGYENPNPFTIRIPAGPLNQVTPGEPERGQPVEFNAGLNRGVASIKSNDSPTWRLNGLEVQLGKSLKDCPVDCIDANAAVILSNLDTVALELTNVAKRAALQLAQARPAANDRRNLSSTLTSARLDAQRAAGRSERYLKLARAITLGWPVVTASCANRAAFCRSVDRSESIAKLRGLYALSRGLTARVVIRTKFITFGRRQRSNPLIRRARRLEMIGNEQLSKLPRVVEDCR